MKRRSKTLDTNCRTFFAASREALQPIDVIQISRKNSSEELLQPLAVKESLDNWCSPRHLFTARTVLEPIDVCKVTNRWKNEECLIPFVFKKWQENYDNGPMFW